MISPPPIPAIVGPTASGKTDYALQLAKKVDGELISVDSRQVYRHLAVGTAKPRGTWVKGVYQVEGVPYHLVDIWEPTEIFSAADFVRLADEAIAAIRSRHKNPILVGGTGLYFKALTEGLAKLPSGDETLRLELRALAEEYGRPYLHAELTKVDPQAAAGIPPNNIQRVLRALEVYRLTGKPISAWHQEHQAEQKVRGPRYPLDLLGREWSREELHFRIEERCRAMLEGGMIEETEDLLATGIPVDAPALTGLGYPRIVAYLDDQLTDDGVFDALIGDTRAYAKRQLTWFRNQMDVKWMDEWKM